MGPTSVGGCPWLIYALQGKLNNSCELVSCLRQGLNEPLAAIFHEILTTNHA